MMILFYLISKAVSISTLCFTPIITSTIFETELRTQGIENINNKIQNEEKDICEEIKLIPLGIVVDFKILSPSICPICSPHV